MAGSSTDFRAVILAGGSGERFWPLSTDALPKQFLRVFGKSSLIRQSFGRVRSMAGADRTFVITSSRLVDVTRRELPEIPRCNIVGEPSRRDTGAAVALGVGVAVGTDGGDPVVGFFPSDHLVMKPAAFRAVLRQAVRRAERESTVITIGIRPDFPSTAYGYIEPQSGKFVEKPNEETARRYLRQGYLWNAGMFIARASVFRNAFAAYAPELLPLADGKVRPKPAELVSAYAGLPRISFDYAVMEKLGAVGVVPGDFGWDDVGGYGAFDKHYPHDAAGNVASGEVRAVESAGNICIAKGARITVLGVSDLVVVTSGNDVLVVPKSRAGELKKIFA